MSKIEKMRAEGFASALNSMEKAELQKLIDVADNNYYRPGVEPILTDAEYDLLRPALKAIDPNDVRVTRVGSPYSVEELRNKVDHPIPMGSLDNTDDMIAGYEPWFNKVSSNFDGDSHVMASLKIDGASIRARYEDGHLTQVATRGNGEVGEDITVNSVLFQYLPTTLSEPVTIDVRGEAILYIDDYKAIKEEEFGIPFDDIAERDRSNPRNIGNGMLSRDDGENCDKIRFLAFNAECDEEFETEQAKFDYLKKLGFEVVPHKLCRTTQDVLDYYDESVAGRDDLPFEIDGVVVCLDDYERQQFFVTKDIKSRLRPKFARAIKFPSKSGITVIESISLSHGHTCGIFPTANLKEVRIGGVNVSRALLNNWDEINRLDVHVGDEVEVILSGDIIPKVIRVTKPASNRQVIEEPKTCPACGSPTTRTIRGKEGAVTYCTNNVCPPAMRGKIDHWIGTAKKGVGILGIGDSVLDSLCDEGILSDASDLYTMTVDEIKDINMKSDSGRTVKIGKSRATKIVKEIADKSEMSISKFLGSLGIELLGRRRVMQLQEEADGKLDKIDQWLDSDNIKNLKIPGLGDAIRTAIIDGIDSNRDLIDKLLANGVKIEEPVEKSENLGIFSGMSFCLTGTRECQREIEENGGELKSGVSKNLTFLVQKDATSQSGKTKKADSYGVKVISVDYLKRALNGEVDLKDMIDNLDVLDVAPKVVKKKGASPKPKVQSSDALVQGLDLD